MCCFSLDNRLKDRATKMVNVTLGANVTLTCDLNLTDYSNVIWYKDGWEAQSMVCFLYIKK